MKRGAKQLEFEKVKLVHGGERAKGKRRSRRPLDPKRSTQLVLRSTFIDAHKEFSFTRNKQRFQFVKQTLYSLAAKYGIQFYRLSINSNHIHSLLRMTNRRLFASFLREVSGKIAMKVVGSAKGRAAGEKFWMTPFTRIVEWGVAFVEACKYVEMNLLESTGAVSYTPRKAKKAAATESLRRKTLLRT